MSTSILGALAGAGGALLGYVGNFIIGGFIGKALVKGVMKILDLIVWALLVPVQWFMNILCDNIAQRFIVDPADNFLPLIIGNGNAELPDTFLTAFQIMGMSLLLVISAMTIYRKMSDPLSEKASIGEIIRNIVVAAIGVMFAYQIMYIISGIFNGTDSTTQGGFAGMLIGNQESLQLNYTNMWNLVRSGLMIEAGDVTDITQGSYADIVGMDLLIDFISGIVTLYLITVMVKELLKFFIEVIERWILLNVYYIISPIAFATLPSSRTNGIMGRFLFGYISQFFVMLLNIWFVQAFVLIINNYDVNAMEDSHGWGNITMCFILIALLRLAQRIDNYLHDMGFSISRTGTGLGREVATAFSLSNMARTATTMYKAGSFAYNTGKNIATWAGAPESVKAGSVANKHAGMTGKDDAGIPQGTTLSGVTDAKGVSGKGAVFGNNDSSTLYENSIDTKGMTFSPEGNKFSSANGRGVLKGTNPDGSIVQGSVSMNRMNGRSVNVSKSDTPVWFTPEPDSAPIGGWADTGLKANEPMGIDDYKKGKPGADGMLASLGAEDASKVVSDGNGHTGLMDDDGNFKAVFSETDKFAYGGKEIKDQRENRANRVELGNNAVDSDGLTFDGMTQAGLSAGDIGGMTKTDDGGFRISDKDGKTLGHVVKDSTSRNLDGSDSYTYQSANDRELAKHNYQSLTGTTDLLHEHMPGKEAFINAHGQADADAAEKDYLQGITKNAAANAATRANAYETKGHWDFVDGSDKENGSFRLYNEEQNKFKEYTPVRFSEPVHGKGESLDKGIPFEGRLPSQADDASYMGARADYRVREFGAKDNASSDTRKNYAPLREDENAGMSPGRPVGFTDYESSHPQTAAQMKEALFGTDSIGTTVESGADGKSKIFRDVHGNVTSMYSYEKGTFGKNEPMQNEKYNSQGELLTAPATPAQMTPDHKNRWMAEYPEQSDLELGDSNLAPGTDMAWDDFKAQNPDAIPEKTLRAAGIDESRVGSVTRMRDGGYVLGTQGGSEIARFDKNQNGDVTVTRSDTTARVNGKNVYGTHNVMPEQTFTSPQGQTAIDRESNAAANTVARWNAAGTGGPSGWEVSNVSENGFTAHSASLMQTRSVQPITPDNTQLPRGAKLEEAVPYDGNLGGADESSYSGGRADMMYTSHRAIYTMKSGDDTPENMQNVSQNVITGLNSSTAGAEWTLTEPPQNGRFTIRDRAATGTSETSGKVRTYTVRMENSSMPKDGHYTNVKRVPYEKSVAGDPIAEGYTGKYTDLYYTESTAQDRRKRQKKESV